MAACPKDLFMVTTSLPRKPQELDRCRREQPVLSRKLDSLHSVEQPHSESAFEKDRDRQTDRTKGLREIGSISSASSPGLNSVLQA